MTPVTAPGGGSGTVEVVAVVVVVVVVKVEVVVVDAMVVEVVDVEVLDLLVTVVSSTVVVLGEDSPPAVVTVVGPHAATIMSRRIKGHARIQQALHIDSR
ncbi:MAG: hypothetical protein P1T08_05530 [Acidimicrobiia bacterium]|nr:hypothetical protein [Acidimicrobiia bacterium]